MKKVSRKFLALLAGLAIGFTSFSFISCSSGSSDDTTPIPLPVVGKKDAATLLNEAVAGSTVDFSTTTLEQGKKYIVSKSITLKNADLNKGTLIVDAENVTLEGIKNGSVALAKNATNTTIKDCPSLANLSISNEVASSIGARAVTDGSSKIVLKNVSVKQVISKRPNLSVVVKGASKITAIVAKDKSINIKIASKEVKIEKKTAEIKIEIAAKEDLDDGEELEITVEELSKLEEEAATLSDAEIEELEKEAGDVLGDEESEAKPEETKPSDEEKPAEEAKEEPKQEEPKEEEPAKAASYTVSFNTNGGSKVDSITVEDKKTVTAPDSPSKTGCEFAGWYSDSALETEFNFETEITADITLYAKWNISEGYKKLEFETNGGSQIAWQAVKIGEKAAKPASPTKAGHKFDSWYSSAELTEEFDFEGTAISEDTKLYAKWKLALSGEAIEISIGHDESDFEISQSGSSYSVPEGFDSYQWYVEGIELSGATTNTCTSVTLPAGIVSRTNMQYRLSVKAVKDGQINIASKIIKIE